MQQLHAVRINIMNLKKAVGIYIPSTESKETRAAIPGI